MYSVDGQDRLVELTDVPQSSVGSPMPAVVSDEHTTILAYLVHQKVPEWDGNSPLPPEMAAIIRFSPCFDYMFGSPNDEAMRGHPLAARGLSPYSAFQVEKSSWVRQLERMNRVHPMHDPQRFEDRKHFIFTFHDSTFECVAKGFAVNMIEVNEDTADMAAKMASMLRQ